MPRLPYRSASANVCAVALADPNATRWCNISAWQPPRWLEMKIAGSDAFQRATGHRDIGGGEEAASSTTETLTSFRSRGVAFPPLSFLLDCASGLARCSTSCSYCAAATELIFGSNSFQLVTFTQTTTLMSDIRSHYNKWPQYAPFPFGCICFVVLVMRKQRGIRGLLCRWPSITEWCTSLLRAPISEMTYTVSSGTINSTIPYRRTEGASASLDSN